ncbi:MAG TPA: energy transducer TonB [Frateuria sp.]|uniref:energy transducer TonB n=1 Tax=Frateuria sp. TaxID=2211372 RepID=UPI002D7F60DC|nr:energy transducer TonB [Frateuria sp.]HET6805292.1 energy transducer TonB [Frateuria sp.]
MNRSSYPARIGRVSVVAWLATGLMGLAGCASAPVASPAAARPQPSSQPPQALTFHGYPWPLDAQGRPLEGTTFVMALVGVSGRVTEVCIDRSSGHAELDRLAVRWLADEHFYPSLKAGKPISGYARMPVVFAPNPKAPGPFPKTLCQTKPIEDVLSSL